MTRKKQASEGAQTLKQAKAAFKARGSTAVSTTEKRQLERGAVLLERASRIKDQEQRKKDLLRKKEEREAKALHGCNRPPLLGTKRRLDKFGYKSSQFHLGAFLKPKPVISKAHEQERCSQEPWEEDGVDDDTLLDLAAGSPVAGSKPPPKATCIQSTRSISQPGEKYVPMTAEDFSTWDGFLERSSQIARELDSDIRVPASANLSFSRRPSFSSGDFDLSLADLEELEMHVSAPQGYEFVPDTSRQLFPDHKVDHGSFGTKNAVWQHIGEESKAAGDLDRKLMPPPQLPERPRSADCPGQTLHPCPPNVSHGVSLADLESLAGEEIQLSQFDSIETGPDRLFDG